MIEINLMPDVKQELLQAQKVRTRVISVAILIVIAALGLVAALSVWVFGVQAARGALHDSAIEEGIAELRAVDDLDETLSVQNQLALISEINSGKRIPTRVFDLLRAVVPAEGYNVSVSSLNLDSETGEMMIEAQSPQGFAAAEVFQKTLEYAILRITDEDGNQEDVSVATSAVYVGESSYGEDQNGQMVLRFTLMLEVTPELIQPIYDNIQILLERDGNITDSYIHAPRSIFAPRADDIEENN